MERQRRYRRVAAGLLVLAGIVLIVAPFFLGVRYLLNTPTLLGLGLGIFSVLMGIGVGLGRLWTAPLVWSVIGLSASMLFVVLTRPWYDDVLQAGVLAAMFTGTLIALVKAKGPPDSDVG